jgi:hypothetical protein
MQISADRLHPIAAITSHGARLVTLTWLHILTVFVAVDPQHWSTIAFRIAAT